ncbi:site-specific integrase [Rothia koreensis]|uniref:site-specific integrase n=1 Tax=Rothia koreensis TaxID=592378 RepID=UPI003F209FD4
MERYLSYSTQIERSPNTVKSYVRNLKDWFAFLRTQHLDWREVRLENVAEFVAWCSDRVQEPVFNRDRVSGQSSRTAACTAGSWDRSPVLLIRQ